MAYFVLQIKGQITNQKTKKALAVGDKVEEKDEIVFKSADAKAVVVSKEKGRYVISAQKVKKNTKGELWCVVDTVLAPADDNIHLSSS